VRTTYLSDKFLNAAYRNTTYTSPATVYAGLLTAVTGAEAGTVTEASFAGYARVAITFGAPGSALGGRQITNSSPVTFAAKSDVGSATIVAVGVYDALTVGNLMDIIPLDGTDPIGVASVDAGDLSADLLVSPTHGLATNQKVRFENFPGLLSLPTGLSEDTVYFVIATGLTTDRFSVSTSQGGAAVNITAQGKALLMRQTDLTVNQNDQVNFATGTLKLADD